MLTLIDDSSGLEQEQRPFNFADDRSRIYDIRDSISAWLELLPTDNAAEFSEFLHDV